MMKYNTPHVAFANDAYAITPGYPEPAEYFVEAMPTRGNSRHTADHHPDFYFREVS